MHRNPKADNTWVPGAEEIAENFDVDKLLAKGGEVLRREVQNLMRESAKGKLSAGSARDLVNYLSLLSKLKIEEEDSARNMSDDELKKLSK